MAKMKLGEHIGIVAVGVLCSGVGFGHVRAADISTDDGLTLRLDGATGAVQAVMVDGKALPRLEGVWGGLSYRELKPVRKHEPKLIRNIDFDNGAEVWAKVANANWEEGEAVAAGRRTDGGADGSQFYVRLGDKQRYGHGVGFKERVPVQPGGVYEISWYARVPSKAASFIVYLRLFDQAGKDVTEDTPTPGKWSFSPWTTTHYQYPIGPKTANTWERLSRTYLVPEGVTHLQVALCLWRGDYVDADSVRVTHIGQGGWLKVKHPTGGLSAPKHNARLLSQHSALPDDDLVFILRYVPGPDHIRVEGEVRDTHKPPRDRALQVRYTLPVGAEGWWWHDDIRTRRRIEGTTVYRNTFSCAGHAVSRYPFSSIDDGSVGLALGVPLDWPRIENREFSLSHGYRTLFDLGLSPLTTKIGAGKATFAFVIYRTDGQWGFRSAVARYYRMFPHFFVKRAQREGCWLFPVRPSEIPVPEDFGLTFWEGFSGSSKERACAREHGIYIFPYTEAWGVRQPLPGVKEREDAPPYEERLATLEEWAADRTSVKKWRGAPRWETARAVLNSLPQEADGRAPFSMDKYGAWAQWWRTNPDPDLPQPNRWSICREHRIDAVLPHADGIYLDSVSPWLGAYENYRKEHIISADLPLTFGTETGRPCLVGAMSHYEFIAWLADHLHEQGKLVHANMFGDAHRFYAHLADVFGSEVGSSGGNRRLSQVESDAVAVMRRTYAYRKPTTNLLQEGNYRKPVPALTREQVEQYIDHQTFYGFYPGIATTGGEEKPGYRNWKRYFRSPEQFEHDRDLFKKYIPIIRRINTAGWEPITHARTSDENVIVERFGRWGKRGLFFTLRNQAEQGKNCTVTIQLVALGAKREDLGSVFAKDLVSDFRAEAKANGAEDGIGFQLTLQPAHTAVISVSGRAE